MQLQEDFLLSKVFHFLWWGIFKAADQASAASQLLARQVGFGGRKVLASSDAGCSADASISLPKGRSPHRSWLYWDRQFALAAGFMGLSWQVGLVRGQWGPEKRWCTHTLPTQPSVMPAALPHPREPGRCQVGEGSQGHPSPRLQPFCRIILKCQKKKILQLFSF